MPESILFLIALVSVLMIGGFIVNKYIIDKTNTDETMFELFQQFAELGIEVANKCISIGNIDISDFKSEEEYIEYLSETITQEFNNQLYLMGLSSKAELFFSDENVYSFIKMLLEKYKDKINIPEDFENATVEVDAEQSNLVALPSIDAPSEEVGTLKETLDNFYE